MRTACGGVVRTEHLWLLAAGAEGPGCSGAAQVRGSAAGGLRALLGSARSCRHPEPLVFVIIVYLPVYWENAEDRWIMGRLSSKLLCFCPFGEHGA